MFSIVNSHRLGELCEHSRVWFVCKPWFVATRFVVKPPSRYVACKHWLEFRLVFGPEECVCPRKGEQFKSSCGNGDS